MSTERLSDFSARWCQELLKSPNVIHVNTGSRRPSPPADKIFTNTLFCDTLNSETTVRAWQILQAKRLEPPNVSPETILLLSLGTGLDGYKEILQGGMFGPIFDQAASICAVLLGVPTFTTVEMTMRWKKRVPLPSVILCRTVVTRREGRKFWIRGTVEDESRTPCCEADIVFLRREQEKL